MQMRFCAGSVAAARTGATREVAHEQRQSAALAAIATTFMHPLFFLVPLGGQAMRRRARRLSHEYGRALVS